MTGTQKLDTLHQWMKEAERIVFFGGAGVSTASGIPDFRSAHGLYNAPQGRSYEETLSHGFLYAHPEAFWHFYRNVMLYPQAKPNPAHLALADLEARGKLRGVVTQNIDGLHQAAGSKNVLELHGSVHRNHCIRCERSFTLAQVLPMATVPRCPDCGGLIRPDVVLYGEPLEDGMHEAAVDLVRQADLLIVGGTSLVVYPAAGLIHYRLPSCRLVLINMEETPCDALADLVIHGDVCAALAGV